jgi:hypothetical protein
MVRQQRAAGRPVTIVWRATMRCGETGDELREVGDVLRGGHRRSAGGGTTSWSYMIVSICRWSRGARGTPGRMEFHTKLRIEGLPEEA